MIVILNGAPRSGKTSIAKRLMERDQGHWVNLGVDAVLKKMTPRHLLPGIGLRPGGERPDLEDFIRKSYLALYESMAAHARLGIKVVSDVGHHDNYSKRLELLPQCLAVLEYLPVLMVGVKADLEDILARRQNSSSEYVRSTADIPVPKPVVDWQEHVHQPGIYDISLNTSSSTIEECCDVLIEELNQNLQNWTAAKRILEIARA